MSTKQLLYSYLEEACPDIHNTRLQALLDVAEGLQKSQNLSLTAMGRELKNESLVKNKIKKVDRLESNKHLHTELEELYGGLSSYVFQYVAHEVNAPIVIDLCYLKDPRSVQMLSAELATKGRSIPLYRDVFESGELQGRAHQFLSNLEKCIKNKKVVIIMDAGFGEDWFREIEARGWYWLGRMRKGRNIKLDEETGWKSVNDLMPEISIKTKSYNNAYILEKQNRPCRIVTTYKSPLHKRKKLSKPPRNDKANSDHHRKSSKEPWILATNLPSEEFDASKVINFYSKRMQIEESFRDLKSIRYGLSARYIRTECVYRWGVKMLLAAIVQIMFWIIGVIGHSQNFQRVFQANTVRDKKVFSYFYLGQLITEYDKLKDLKIDPSTLGQLIEQELARVW